MKYFGWLGQFPRFAAAGAFGTLAHYALLIVVVSGLDQSPVLGTSLGAALGALVNYSLNYRYTFASTTDHGVALPRFLLLAAVGLVFNAAIVGALVFIGFHYLIAQIVATGCILLVNYIVSKIWIFRKPTV